MNNFKLNNAEQRERRDKYVLPWYEKHADIVTLVDDDPEFQELGIDTILIGKNRRVTNVEEKIVGWPGYTYQAFAFETDSCTVPGHESPGWMVTCKACALLYCFAQPEGWLLAYWIDMPQLLNWFWPRVATFDVFQMEEENRSRGRKVPIADVTANVITKRFELRG